MYCSHCRWTFMLKQLQAAKQMCRSCPTLFLLVLLLLPLVCAFYNIDSSSVSRQLHVPMDPIATEITKWDCLDNSDYFVLFFAWSFAVSVLSVILIIWSFAFECCLCFNMAYVRGQRARERKTDLCRFRLFLVLAVLIYAPSAGFCFYRYHQLRYEVPEKTIANCLQSADERMWDKFQIWFDCCGIQNYTFWFHHWDPDVNIVPDSCCKSYEPHCGNFSKLDQIYLNGCLPNVTDYVNDQMRHHTMYNQLFALICGITMIIGYCVILHLSRTEYYGDFMCCKMKANVADRNDDQEVVVNNIEEDVNENANGDVVDNDHEVNATIEKLAFEMELDCCS